MKGYGFWFVEKSVRCKLSDFLSRFRSLVHVLQRTFPSLEVDVEQQLEMYKVKY